MADSLTPGGNAPQWDDDLVFYCLGDPVRMKIFSLLACNGPMTAAELKAATGKLTIDTTRKLLDAMRSAGLVVMTDSDHGDGRCSLYGLPPSIPIITTPAGKIANLGFCQVRCSSIAGKSA